MDAVSDMARSDDRYMFLLLGSILWLLMDDQSNIFLFLEDFKGYLYRFCIYDLYLHLHLLQEVVLCFTVDLCDRSVVPVVLEGFDGCSSFHSPRSIS